MSNLPMVLTENQTKQGAIDLLTHFPENKCNLAMSCKTISYIPPAHNVVIRYVKISDNFDDGDIYRTKDMGEGEASLTAQASMKIGAANGVKWLKTEIIKERDNNGKLLSVTANVWGVYTDLTGQQIPITGSKSIDFGALMQSGKKPGDINARREYAVERTETGAKSRAIKKAFGIKGKYKIADLDKPFVAASLEFDYDVNNPIDRKYLLDRQNSATNMIYGGSGQGQSEPGLNPNNEIPQQTESPKETSSQQTLVQQIRHLMHETGYVPKNDVDEMDEEKQQNFLVYLQNLKSQQEAGNA